MDNERDLNSEQSPAGPDIASPGVKDYNLIQQAEQLIAQGKPDQALEILTNLLDRDNSNEEALLVRANLYQFQGLYNKALNDYNDAIELNPRYASPYYGRGEVYRLLKLPHKALSDLSQALKLAPDSAQILGCRGIIQRELKDYQKAIQDFDRAIQIAPENTWLYGNRAEAYCALKDYPKAIIDYNRVLELNASQNWIYPRRAYVYLWASQLEFALADFVHSYKTSPANLLNAWMIEWVKMCIQPAQPSPEIAKRLESIAARQPASPAAYLCRGVMSWLKNEFDKSLTQFETTISLNPAEPGGYFWQGMAYASLSQNEEAQSSIDKALETGLAPILLQPLGWLRQKNDQIFKRYCGHLRAAPITRQDTAVEPKKADPLIKANLPQNSKNESGIQAPSNPPLTFPVLGNTPASTGQPNSPARPPVQPTTEPLPVPAGTLAEEVSRAQIKTPVPPSRSVAEKSSLAAEVNRVDFTAQKTKPVKEPAVSPVITGPGKGIKKAKKSWLVSLMGIGFIAMVFALLTLFPGSRVNESNQALNQATAGQTPVEVGETQANENWTRTNPAVGSPSPRLNVIMPTIFPSIVPSATTSPTDSAPAFTPTTAPAQPLFISYLYSVSLNNEDQVFSLAYSPDGLHLASGSKDNTVKVWDTANGRPLWLLNGHTEEVLTVAFSPDGKLLASGSNDKTVKLWDSATGKEVTTLAGHKVGINLVTFSPDGKLLASGSEDKTIKLWDVPGGKEIHTLEGHKYPVTGVAFSPDGKLLASSSNDKTIKIWEVSTGREVATLEEQPTFVNAVAFSPDGTTLASGNKDGTVKLWSVSDWKEIAILSGHTGEIYTLSFSPGGKVLASGSEDSTIKLWDVKDRRELASLKGHSLGVISVAFNPKGKVLASGSRDKTIKLWNIQVDGT